MGFFTSVLGILGFAIGIPIGLILGFFVLIYSQPTHEDVKNFIFRSRRVFWVIVLLFSSSGFSLMIPIDFSG